VATVEECEAALHELARMLRDVDSETRDRHVVDRTVSAWISDLKECFTARLGAEGLTDIVRGGDHAGQIRLRLKSDDLVALTKGDLGFPTAWATGRVRIDASIADVLRLRTLL
jgi:hypothetical protein